MKDPVKDKLKRFGLFAELGEDSFFPTIESAVGSQDGRDSVTGLPKGTVAS